MCVGRGSVRVALRALFMGSVEMVARFRRGERSGGGCGGCLRVDLVERTYFSHGVSSYLVGFFGGGCLLVPVFVFRVMEG